MCVNEIIDSNDFSKRVHVEKLIKSKKDKLGDLKKQNMDLLKLLHFWNQVFI